MKNFLTTLFMFCLVYSSWAQQGINYKALIKDDLGNVVANQSITIQFQILEGVSQVLRYQETHTPTTSSNGLVSLVIGTGTVNSGVFGDINWSVSTFHLNVKVNTGSGLVDMGTTRLQAVPFAEHAKTATRAGSAATADNATGLEALDQGNGIGWRLMGRNTTDYGNIGSQAVDLSYAGPVFDPVGALGGNSFAANGATKATGTNSTALGYFAVASGLNSMAIGTFTIAPSYSEFVVGKYNTEYTPNSATSSSGTDRLFVIGNGSSGSRSDALVILKNGYADFGQSLRVKGEVHATSTGLANMLPIAYGSHNGGPGHQNETGHSDILGGTGNFTVTRENGTNIYTIRVPGLSLHASNTVCNVIVNTSNFRSVNTTYSGGNIQVHVFSSTFNRVASPFQFVIYKL